MRSKNDGFEPYSVKSLRDIAGQSPQLDALLLTVMSAADQVYSKASGRLPVDIREKIGAHKHAGQHEQACGIACKAFDIHFMDTYDRQKFHQWWAQAVEQVRTDQEAFTIFTYGIIGQTPPALQTAVPPPPPPKKD